VMTSPQLCFYRKSRKSFRISSHSLLTSSSSRPSLVKLQCEIPTFCQKKISGKNNNSKPILERGSVVQGCVSCKFTDQSLITAWRDHGKRAFCSLCFNSTSARLTGRQGREDHDRQRISIRIIRLAGVSFLLLTRTKSLLKRSAAALNRYCVYLLG
jgi:hypothetical protein